jgi:hypothetical protein
LSRPTFDFGGGRYHEATDRGLLVWTAPDGIDVPE